MRKVLFSTPIQPYPVHFNNVSLTDVMTQRLTQRQRLATPEEVFQEMKWYWRNFPDMQQILVYDEDFIKYRDEVLSIQQ